MIIYAVYLIIKYRAFKKHQPNKLENDYLKYLKKNREYLKAQKKFLNTYLYWGIFPVYPIMLLFSISIWERASIYLIVVINLATIGVGVYGGFLNKKRVKKEITPRISSINKLINQLEH
jgi:hypothetical protein